MKIPDCLGRGIKRDPDFIFVSLNGQLRSVRVSQSELGSVIGQVWFNNALINISQLPSPEKAYF